MNEFSHVQENGKAKMVDVSAKDKTCRTAIAACTVLLSAQTFAKIQNNQMQKGDVLCVAKIAGIQAAKRTHELIPLCHPVLLTGVDITFECVAKTHEIIIRAQVKCCGETGVEMEALVAAQTAALTVYDMCKAVQRDIVINDLHLCEKSGGQSGDYYEKRVLAVCISEKKGTVKKEVPCVRLIEDHGIEGDAHAGTPGRQVSLLAKESVDKLRDKISNLSFGAFAENIQTTGITLHTLPVGTKLKIGDCILTITQIGKQCHGGCEIQRLTGECVMPKEGVFAKVDKGGWIQPGNTIEVL